MMKDVLITVLPQILAQTEQRWNGRASAEGGGPNG